MVHLAASFCEWRTYKHDKSLPEDILHAIKPIYEDLSKEDLLKRCIGGFNQSNESYNQLIWKISPKIISINGLKTIKLVAHISACVFNGSTALLQIFESMEVHSGPNSHRYVANGRCSPH